MHTICLIVWRYTANVEQCLNLLTSENSKSPFFYEGLSWSSKVLDFARKFGMQDVIRTDGYNCQSIADFENECRRRYGVPYIYDAFQYNVKNMLVPPSMCKDVFLFLYLFFFKRIFSSLSDSTANNCFF